MKRQWWRQELSAAIVSVMIFVASMCILQTKIWKSIFDINSNKGTDC